MSLLLLAPPSLSLDTIGIPSVGNKSFDGFENTWAIVVAATIPVVDASQTSTVLFEINPGVAWYIDSPDGFLSHANAKGEYP